MWAIDPSLFTTSDGQTWLLYSGNIFGCDNKAGNQKLYLLPLRNPLTPLDTHRPTCISQPDYEWERNLGKANVYWVSRYIAWLGCKNVQECYFNCYVFHSIIINNRHFISYIV